MSRHLAAFETAHLPLERIQLSALLVDLAALIVQVAPQILYTASLPLQAAGRTLLLFKRINSPQQLVQLMTVPIHLTTMLLNCAHLLLPQSRQLLRWCASHAEHGGFGTIQDFELSSGRGGTQDKAQLPGAIPDLDYPASPGGLSAQHHLTDIVHHLQARRPNIVRL
jgi:hypothetical protein